MKREIVWLIASCLMVLSLVLASCGPAVTEEEVEEEEVEEEEVEVPTLSIGETFQISEIAVTISEAIVTDSYEYIDEATGKMGTLEAYPDGSLLIVTAEIKNVGDIGAPEQGQLLITAYDSEGTRYITRRGVAHYYLPYPGEDALPIAKIISPGDKIEGKMFFHIPEEASGLKIAYSTDQNLLEPIAM